VDLVPQVIRLEPGETKNDEPSGVTSKPANEGHLKTGQRAGGRTRVVIPRWRPLRQLILAILFEHGLYWQHLGGGYGSAGMRPERRPRGRNGGGGVSRPAPLPFWREGVKSREREGSALASYKSLLPCSVQSAAAVLVRQLLGPHFSTWPWCSRRSSMALTAATSASSLPQSSTGRLEVSSVLARS